MKALAAILGLCLIAGVALAQQAPIINEFVNNHTGTDTHEFVEVFGTPSTDLSNLTILEIEGDSSLGVIDGVFNVGTTNAGGFWTTAFIINDLENGTLSFLLVSNFSGSQGDDLDTNDDGTFDVTPWSSIVDSIAVTDGGGGDLTYANVVLTPGFDGDPFTPNGASRIPNGIDTDTVSDWVRNDFGGFGLPGFIDTLDPGNAINTPNAVNAIPEPGVIILVGLGPLALLVRKRR